MELRFDSGWAFDLLFGEDGDGVVTSCRVVLSSSSSLPGGFKGEEPLIPPSAGGLKMIFNPPSWVSGYIPTPSHQNKMSSIFNPHIPLPSESVQPQYFL